MGVEVGTINIDWTYPNGHCPPLVITDGQTKQFTAAFTWQGETSNLPIIDLNGTVCVIVNGQTLSGTFQIGAYSSEAGFFERPDTIYFVMSQGGNMSDAIGVTVPDFETTFPGPTFTFSGLTLTGAIDNKGTQAGNLLITYQESVLFNLALALV